MMQVKSRKSTVNSQKSRPLTPVPRTPFVYLAQNRALHKARAQLGLSLDDLREMAGQIHLGIKSLSRLSLAQRHQLIAELILKGAQVKNPAITRYDEEEEARAKGKLKRFPAISEKQLKMLDTLAAQVHWRETDGYLRFCHKTIKAPVPHNGREVTTLRLALQSLIDQQHRAKPPGVIPAKLVPDSDPGAGIQEG